MFQEFSRQDRWALCYNEASLTFTVKPGEALFLGDFDADASLGELESRVVMTGRFMTTGSLVHFFDTVTPPRFAPIDDEAVAQAQAMADRYMPKTTSPVKAAELQPARFGTGSDLFGSNRVCGGYFAGSAKDKKRR